MGEIKAIETVYNGYRFRSRLEARWAVFFDAMHIKYEYEPEGFVGWNDVKYLPDFYIPEEKVYIEVKGHDDQLERDWEKIACAIDFQSTPVSEGLILLGEIPNPDKVGWGSVPIFSYLYWNEGVTSSYAAFSTNDDKRLDKFRRSQIVFGLDAIMKSVFPGIRYGDEFSSAYGQMPGNLTTKERWVDADSLIARDYSRLKSALKAARSARFEHGEHP